MADLKIHNLKKGFDGNEIIKGIDPTSATVNSSSSSAPPAVASPPCCA